MWWDMGAGWWWGIGGVFMVLFWGGVIALIVWAVIKLSKSGGGGGGGEPRKDALDIAKERYARGEISKEEFDQIKKDLQ